MKYIKENWKFFVFAIVICIIGGYFTTMYSIGLLDQSALDEAIKQVGSKELVIIVSVIQIALYAETFCGFGIILSNKTGLWKKFEKNKVAIIATIIISVVAGLLISVVDKYLFGHFIEPVSHLYDSKPTLNYIIMSFTYGGVYEEILMRLFLMSLIAWIISKIFCQKQKEIPVIVFVIANIIAALLFAAGHIPSTIQTFGYVNALILVRCFLLNGAFGLAAGWLYRKYGIGYAMLAHFGAHLVSKLIWFYLYN